MAGVAIESNDVARQQDQKVAFRIGQALLDRVERVRRALEAEHPGMTYPVSAVLRVAIERGLRALEQELKAKPRR